MYCSTQGLGSQGVWSGKSAAVITDADPFGVDIHQAARVADIIQCDRTGARSFPPGVGYGDYHVATAVCGQSENFDLARGACR